MYLLQSHLFPQCMNHLLWPLWEHAQMQMCLVEAEQPAGIPARLRAAASRGSSSPLHHTCPDLHHLNEEPRPPSTATHLVATALKIWTAQHLLFLGSQSQGTEG